MVILDLSSLVHLDRIAGTAGDPQQIIMQLHGDQRILICIPDDMVEVIIGGFDPNILVDKRRIDLAKPIKVVGEYPVSVALYRDIKATVNVAVIDQKTVEEAPAAEAEAEEAQVEAMVEEAVAEVEAAVEEIVDEVQAETAE